MQNKSTKSAAIVLVIALIFFTYQKFAPKSETTKAVVETSATTTTTQSAPNETSTGTSNEATPIEELTKESIVVAYVKAHGELPNYYITKREAKKLGWNPSEGNLCDVLPGHAIGGDVFYNREHKLPEKSGRTWHEADLNYNCDTRNSDRLLYSTDHLIYTTHNHYKTFEKQ